MRPNLPVQDDNRLAVMIAGHEINRQHWHLISPKPGRDLTIHHGTGTYYVGPGLGVRYRRFAQNFQW